MECNAYREAISARIDGEGSVLETRAVEAHLESCAACRSWSEVATAITRAARFGVAEAVPDLAGPILAAAGRSARRPGRPGRAESPAAVARFGLLMVAAAQLALAVPALLGRDSGASIHVAHEQGSWALALAVGLVVAAMQPRRAAALLPLAAALAAGLAFTMAVDIAAGRTQAAAEAPHGLAFLGFGLLWLLARQARSAGTPRAPHVPRVPQVPQAA